MSDIEPKTDECMMYLVRHGATKGNLATPAILQGRDVDHGLCDYGRQQAEKTAKLLADRKLFAAFSSPLKRARETAETIAKLHEIKVCAIEDLMEADVGKWSGRSWNDIAREEPDAYERFRNDPGNYGYRGGETMKEVLNRVKPTIERIMSENLGRNILVVAHSVVNRTFIGNALGLSFSQGRAVSQSNCALNVVRYRDGKFAVRTVNSVFHLL